MSSSKNLEYEKTSFLSKSNSIFIEEMYMKFVNNDPTLPESWKRYFIEIGDEKDIIVKEINGPSWSPSKKFLINKEFKQEEKTCRNDWEQKSDKIILNNASGYSDGVLINYIAE